jgi:phosphatidylserine decarboxylase
MNTAIRAARREVPAIFWSLLALAGILLLRRRVLWAALAAAAWAGVAAFFRDPERTPDRDDPRAILAPADGTVRKVERVDETPWMGGPVQRITLFLSLLDVHVQRSPADGQVAWMEYRPGSFAPAFQDAADANEANFVGIETARGKLLVAQMAGVLARRIVCWTAPGARLARGQRFGLIRFGSRVDLYAPLEVTVTVAPGQQVYGGQTVVAVWPAAER